MIEYRGSHTLVAQELSDDPWGRPGGGLAETIVPTTFDGDTGGGIGGGAFSSRRASRSSTPIKPFEIDRAIRPMLQVIAPRIIEQGRRTRRSSPFRCTTRASGFPPARLFLEARQLEIRIDPDQVDCCALPFATVLRLRAERRRGDGRLHGLHRKLRTTSNASGTDSMQARIETTTTRARGRRPRRSIASRRAMATESAHRLVRQRRVPQQQHGLRQSVGALVDHRGRSDRPEARGAMVPPGSPHATPPLRYGA